MEKLRLICSNSRIPSIIWNSTLVPIMIQVSDVRILPSVFPSSILGLPIQHFLRMFQRDSAIFREYMSSLNLPMHFSLSHAPPTLSMILASLISIGAECNRDSRYYGIFYSLTKEVVQVRYLVLHFVTVRYRFFCREQLLAPHQTHKPGLHPLSATVFRLFTVLVPEGVSCLRNLRRRRAVAIRDPL
jgi:hypothetical protein